MLVVDVPPALWSLGGPLLGSWARMLYLGR